MSSQTLAAGALADTVRTCPAPNLVLYDGVCGLCNRTVRFLLRIDGDAVLCFAPLQGATARRVRDRVGFDDDLSTMVYVREFNLTGERAFFRSDAVLTALADVGGVWWLVSILRLVPRPLRDTLYRHLVRHRYEWFGRHDSCPAPPSEARARFLP